ncbi:MAG: hypothetical protein U9Q15_04700 [Patescibacteria group bacterium]|nr:hypothetical protein [Patescibacteria group bacterium]
MAKIVINAKKSSGEYAQANKMYWNTHVFDTQTDIVFTDECNAKWYFEDDMQLIPQ